MITSFFDGRVRIRAEALKHGNNMAAVVAFVKNREGVLQVVPNPRTGSLLIRYDPEKIPREALLEAAATLERQFGNAGKRRSSSGKNGSRISPFSPLGESLLLGGLYALTAIAGYGSKTLHVLLGLAFAALAGVHAYDRKHCILPRGTSGPSA